MIAMEELNWQRRSNLRTTNQPFTDGIASKNDMKLFSAIGRWAGRAFGLGRSDKVSRSKLVGLYLNQANSREAYSPEHQENRQRRNGKHSTNRERA